MDAYELEPYSLAGAQQGKWALTITRWDRPISGFSHQPFYGGPEFKSRGEALRYGIAWVAARGGMVRKRVLCAATRSI